MIKKFLFIFSIMILPSNGDLIFNPPAFDSPNIYVAAYNSVGASSADYVCDGTDDDIVIQQAIDYVYNNYPIGRTTGGLLGGKASIFFLAGNYNIGSAIHPKEGIHLIGEGWGSTFFKMEDGVTDDMFRFEENTPGTYAGTLIQGFYFDGNYKGSNGIDGDADDATGSFLKNKDDGNDIFLYDIHLEQNLIFSFEPASGEGVSHITDPWGYWQYFSHIEECFGIPLYLQGRLGGNQNGMFMESCRLVNNTLGMKLVDLKAGRFINNEFDADGTNEYSVIVTTSTDAGINSLGNMFIANDFNSTGSSPTQGGIQIVESGDHFAGLWSTQVGVDIADDTAIDWDGGTSTGTLRWMTATNYIIDVVTGDLENGDIILDVATSTNGFTINGAPAPTNRIRSTIISNNSFLSIQGTTTSGVFVGTGVDGTIVTGNNFSEVTLLNGEITDNGDNTIRRGNYGDDQLTLIDTVANTADDSYAFRSASFNDAGLYFGGGKFQYKNISGTEVYSVNLDGYPAVIRGEAMAATGMGSPGIVYDTSVTGQGGNIGKTTIYTSPAESNMYKISAYQVCTTAGTAGNLSTTFYWTDATGVERSDNIPVDIATNATNFAGGDLYVQTQASSVIALQIDLTGATGSPIWAIYITIERMN